MSPDFDRYVQSCKRTYFVPGVCSRKLAVDIGANLGGFSLAYGNRFDKIVYFEPHPKNFLTHMNHVRGKRHIHGHAVCVEDGDGKKDLFLHRTRNSRCWSTRPEDCDPGRYGKSIQVPSISFLEALKRSGRHISYLKCDCEGAELFWPWEEALESYSIEAIGIEIHQVKIPGGRGERLMKLLEERYVLVHGGIPKTRFPHFEGVFLRRDLHEESLRHGEAEQVPQGDDAAPARPDAV